MTVVRTIQLNDAQRSAVEHTDGPLLIIAGAGAGKTKTITERIVHIIKKGVSPHHILAITFTNKAAKEMLHRVNTRLEEEGIISGSYNPLERPMVKTFHSFGVFIIRENASRLGLNRHFTILDSSDALSVLKQATIAEGLDPKEHDPGKWRNAISRYKADFVTIDQLEREANSHSQQLLVRIWRRYESHLKKENCLDFDDLLTRSVELLRTNKEVLGHYQNRFQYIHVDEYQDTNQVQYELCKLLAAKSHNICVVGDGDQNIYSWRGANIQNILTFEKDYPETKTVLLEENYRSTQNILLAANTVIRKNTIRADKNLFTRGPEGEPISIAQNYDEKAEADFVARTCSNLIESGTDPAEIAILYRANFQSRAIEDACLRAGVPYQVLGVKFFERREIKDVVSYLRVALNRESLTDMKRALETPKRGIGKVTMLKYLSGEFETLPAAMQKKLSDFNILLDTVQEYATTKTLSETLFYIITASGIEKTLLNGTDDDRERLENIRELVSFATKYDDIESELALERFFEESTLVSDQDTEKEGFQGIKLLTVHASKGLEFDTVFIVGLEHDLFPHQRIGTEKKNKEDSEEERRLFYVAVTRARHKLYLSYAEIRTIYGSRQLQIPSEFIGDIGDTPVIYEDTRSPDPFSDTFSTIVYL
ncbi:MAG: helicase PcrA [Candidatus Parcubacteria bacterium]|jgi:DNA helicase-2/ATP-dependent DNA helicase PcrA